MYSTHIFGNIEVVIAETSQCLSIFPPSHWSRRLLLRNDMEGEKTLTPDSVPPTAMTIGDETSTSSSGQSAERVLAAADENGLSQAVAIPISMAVADDALPDLETPPDSINFSREASNLSSDIVSVRS